MVIGEMYGRKMVFNPRIPSERLRELTANFWEISPYERVEVLTWFGCRQYTVEGEFTYELIEECSCPDCEGHVIDTVKVKLERTVTFGRDHMDAIRNAANAYVQNQFDVEDYRLDDLRKLKLSNTIRSTDNQKLLPTLAQLLGIDP